MLFLHFYSKTDTHTHGAANIPVKGAIIEE